MFGHTGFARLLCFSVTLIVFQDISIQGQLLNIENGISLFGYDHDSSSTKNGEMDNFRLPKNIFPKSYELNIEPDLEHFTLNGVAKILVEIQGAVKNIVLNAKDLKIINVTVNSVDKDTKDEIAENVFHSLEAMNEQMSIYKQNNLNFHDDTFYSILITYSGQLRNDMTGFYKSSYSQDNKTKWLAVTQFEPTYARRAFPCFDEPSMKATFKVSIKRREDQIALSNTPVYAQKEDKEGMIIDYFEETPLMSPYLLAMFVGEFVSFEADQNIKVYTHSNYINQTHYIAKKAANLLKAMENYTGEIYTLKKMDLLAIPDFEAGAMENWGLNTYRERLLLVTDKSKTKSKESVTTVVQHELAHQWFGDLVTCEWWSYTWLNEGFATFFEYFATEMVEPDWRLEDTFIHEVHQKALKADQKPMHPMSVSVKSPEEIKNMFDVISYQKGGSILRMIKYIISEKFFKEALKKYLHSNMKKTANPDKLWDKIVTVLENNNSDIIKKIEFNDFANFWTNQSGYPLITVNKNENSYCITQERFFTSLPNDTETLYTDRNTTWIVGLTYTTQNELDFNNNEVQWLKNKNTKLPVKGTNDGWYIFNLKSSGFYRVNYDYDNWHALINQLTNNHEIINVINRAQLIDDAFNLAKANLINYTIPLDLSTYLENEKDVLPWYSVMEEFDYLLERTRRHSFCYDNLKTYVNSLAEKIYTYVEDLIVNKNTTDHKIKTSWDTFSSWACRLENKYCVESATKYFNRWMETGEIPVDIKDAAWCIGVKKGNSRTWDMLLNVYQKSDDSSERTSALVALACSDDSEQLSKYLGFILEGEKGPIRQQDFIYIYRSLGTTPKGIKVMIDFLANNMNTLLNKTNYGNDIATSIYSILASKVSHDDEITSMDNLRNNERLPSNIKKTFNKLYDEIDNNVKWFQNNYKSVNNWVVSYNDTHRTTTENIPTVYPTTPSPSTTPEPHSSASKSQVCVLFLITTALSWIITIHS